LFHIISNFLTFAALLISDLNNIAHVMLADLLSHESGWWQRVEKGSS